MQYTETYVVVYSEPGVTRGATAESEPFDREHQAWDFLHGLDGRGDVSRAQIERRSTLVLGSFAKTTTR
ncbi:hypothetical protein XF35_01700 [Streptomyces platensis subsp. clarensis]|nr:hypothetical protein [Streptomyces platensis subsp. clarensis]